MSNRQLVVLSGMVPDHLVNQLGPREVMICAQIADENDLFCVYHNDEALMMRMKNHGTILSLREK